MTAKARVYKTYNYQCVECEEPFTTHYKPAVCCSHACGHKLGKRKSDLTRAANAEARNTKSCQHCGSVFRRTRNSKGAFCSTWCAGQASRIDPAVRERLARYRKTLVPVEVISIPPIVPHPIKETPVKYSFVCKMCEGRYDVRVGDTRSAFCSDRCSKRYNSYRFGRKYEERAKYYKVEYAPFDVLEVFREHKWRCNSCNVKTPHELRGTNFPNAPELDHVLALSRGGGHTRSNAQLLCRACNGNKSNRNVFD